VTADPNVLYYGDNLDVLRRHIKDESVDLVYLDPPFNSNASYNVLFAEHGTQSPAQITAFEDTWRWDEAAAYDHQQTVEEGGPVADALVAFWTFLGTSNMLAYLSMMAPRLKEIRRVMKNTANLFVHCDPTASHYLKMLLDAVFGPQQFLNEIIWCYDTGGRSTTSFPAKHEVILRFGRTSDVAFYYDNVALPRDASTMHETVVTDEDGRKYQRNLKGGKEYRYYLDKGVLPNDWWAASRLSTLQPRNVSGIRPQNPSPYWTASSGPPPKKGILYSTHSADAARRWPQPKPSDGVGSGSTSHT
jgi:adenine specific DNA methylase Mod